ncbi:hypothetical protein AVEN_12883-1 [Araneus ventricosus]|uniref:Integrase catalytic domain-containing protein n=1 Tax=Araneus ventricosus TaxID=182803 RepID=A0A4Y2HKE6_ARAVE|nr:hypothetical protein AVEN_12883-1 [Araneus ventricosus]
MSSEPMPLPPDRVSDCAVFEIVGIDLAGPFFLKNGEKVWIALFTCAVYRASHLELMRSLSSDSFNLAMRRFIARRGRPKTIYSDNGTNFKGSCNKLSKLDWNHIQREANLEECLGNSTPQLLVGGVAGGREESRELVPLTPSMFLIENRFSDVTDFEAIDQSHFQNRIRFPSKLLNDLRQRFRREYLG